MYESRDRLVILDADGTTINAFSAIERTFAHHGMDIGDLERFQKRRHLSKYLGVLKESPPASSARSASSGAGSSSIH